MPVWARPMMSRPSIVAGMVLFWIGRGSTKPAAAMPRRMFGLKSNSPKPSAVRAPLGVALVSLNRDIRGLPFGDSRTSEYGRDGAAVCLSPHNSVGRLESVAAQSSVRILLCAAG